MILSDKKGSGFLLLITFIIVILTLIFYIPKSDYELKNMIIFCINTYFDMQFITHGNGTNEQVRNE